MLPNNWLTLLPRDIAALAPVQEVQLPVFHAKKIRVEIKREDLLHPLLGGNKLYKLHGYLRDYGARGLSLPIATFGGAYSNHIIAAAVAAKMNHIPIIGVIRGERPKRLSPTLQDAEDQGMRLMFVSRSAYRQREDQEYLSYLEREFGPCYWIPEGGAGTLGSAGMQALASVIAQSETPPNFVFHACGTGTSLAGLVAGFADSRCKVCSIGVAVLKGDQQMDGRIREQIRALTTQNASWQLLHDYHGGGYAKLSDAMALFMQSIETSTGVPLDPVYTVKMFSAIVDLAERDFFSPGARVLAIHSGGLQGRRGFNI